MGQAILVRETMPTNVFILYSGQASVIPMLKHLLLCNYSNQEKSLVGQASCVALLVKQRSHQLKPFALPLLQPISLPARAQTGFPLLFSHCSRIGI